MVLIFSCRCFNVNLHLAKSPVPPTTPISQQIEQQLFSAKYASKLADYQQVELSLGGVKLVSEDVTLPVFLCATTRFDGVRFLIAEAY